MPVRLSELLNQRTDTTVNTALGALKVTFKPHALTPADNARLAEKTGTASFAELLTQMERLIVWWDLEGPVFHIDNGSVVVAEGENVPVRKEVLQHMSSTLLYDIYRSVLESSRPKSTNSPDDSRTIFSDSSF